MNPNIQYSMRIIVKLCFFALLLMLFSCKEDVIELNEPFKIEFNNTRSFSKGNLSISFDDLLGESRCPQDAECVWAGQVIVLVSIQQGEYSEEFELVAGEIADGQTGTIIFNDYIISLQNVSPTPTLDNETPSKSKYSITLEITAL